MIVRNLESFLGSTLTCCSLACALMGGCVPPAGCCLTIKGPVGHDVVTASSAGPEMGPSDWVGKKGRE